MMQRNDFYSFVAAGVFCGKPNAEHWMTLKLVLRKLSASGSIYIKDQYTGVKLDSLSFLGPVQTPIFLWAEPNSNY